jgi:hypothetical protein
MFLRNGRTPSFLAHRLAGAALACIGTVALASEAHANVVTFNYTGADVMYTIDPGTYRIAVYGAQGGNASQDGDTASGGGSALKRPQSIRLGKL